MSESATRRSFETHDAYEPTDNRGFAVTTTPLDAIVTVGADRIVVTVLAPTLDATAAESVPAVVEDGWIETFERRVDDPSGVVRVEEVAVTVEREGDHLAVDARFEPAPERAASEAKAVVDFVEGTWVGGLVPGYDYESPAADLLERATDRGQVADVDT